MVSNMRCVYACVCLCVIVAKTNIFTPSRNARFQLFILLFHSIFSLFVPLSPPSSSSSFFQLYLWRTFTNEVICCGLLRWCSLACDGYQGKSFVIICFRLVAFDIYDKTIIKRTVKQFACVVHVRVPQSLMMPANGGISIFVTKIHTNTHSNIYKLNIVCVHIQRI